MLDQMQVTALDELTAVNNIIGTIGEAPINTLEEMTDVDAINALSILRNISRQEQSRGWSFNKIQSYTLNVDTNNGKIPWSSDYLYIKDNYGHKLIKQGDYVKDLTRNSLQFEKPLDVELVIHVPYDYLPEPMKYYVLTKACFVFQSRYFGDDSLTKVTQQEIQEAWQYLQEFEIDNNNFSMLDNTYVEQLRMR